MSWRKFTKHINGNKKFLHKLICATTATTFLMPLGLTYAAETPDNEVALNEFDDGETSMFNRVPADSWIYKSINELIATGKVPRYKKQIKEGETLTRFELALITYYGIREMKRMTPEEQSILKPLEEEFRYDLGKVSLMHRLSQLDDERSIDEQAEVFKQQTIATLSPSVNVQGGSGIELTPPPKKPMLDDKLSIWGFARFRLQRNDHGDGGYRKYNHFNLHVISQYKINDNWQIVLGNEFQRSTDRINSMEGDEGNQIADADLNMQTNIAQELIFEGNYPGMRISIGRMYDESAYGFALDNRTNGVKVDLFGKINITAFHGRVYDWPQEDIYGYPNDDIRSLPFLGWPEGYEIKTRQEYTALKFDTRPDDKSKISWGIFGISPSSRHYQKDDKNRIIYGYVGYENQITPKWKVTGLVETNNAHQDTALIKGERDFMTAQGFTANAGKYTTSKSPVWYLRADYGHVDLFKPNTWGIYAFYLNQPTLRQYSDAQAFDNMRGFRFGAAYTVLPGMLLEGYATFAKDVDTKERRNDVRGQLNMFF